MREGLVAKTWILVKTAVSVINKRTFLEQYEEFKADNFKRFRFVRRESPNLLWISWDSTTAQGKKESANERTRI